MLEMSQIVRAMLVFITERSDDDTLRDFFSDTYTFQVHLNALCSDVSNGCTTVVNVDAATFGSVLRDAGAGKARRVRDHKGQYCKTKYDNGILRAYKDRQWVVVLPWSVGRLVRAYFEDVHKNNELPSVSKTEWSDRDYAATVGMRAAERGLASRPHRNGLLGRRNHFAPVPKMC